MHLSVRNCTVVGVAPLREGSSVHAAWSHVPFTTVSVFALVCAHLHCCGVAPLREGSSVHAMGTTFIHPPRCTPHVVTTSRLPRCLVVVPGVIRVSVHGCILSGYRGRCFFFSRGDSLLCAVWGSLPPFTTDVGCCAWFHQGVCAQPHWMSSQ